jgi:hypothetical protein
MAKYRGTLHHGQHIHQGCLRTGHYVEYFEQTERESKDKREEIACWKIHKGHCILQRSNEEE